MHNMNSNRRKVKDYMTLYKQFRFEILLELNVLLGKGDSVIKGGGPLID